MKKDGSKKDLAKKIGSVLTAATVAVGSMIIPAYAATYDLDGTQTLTEAEATPSKVVAFKGAEGGGMYSKGGRGAIDEGEKIEVYHVTNLNDSGEGSFRDAVSKGNRIVVFDVSGYVDLLSNVSIGHDNVTVLGQTAPGDGICFRSNNVKVGANNVILRYVKFRVGAKMPDGTDTRAQDGLEITDDCQNVIVDHCSVSWGTDENLSAYAVKDVTIQWSIVAEALNQSVHDKGEHSYAAIWGGVNLSVHHNIISTHKSRNPKIGTSETVAMTEGYTDSQTLVDMKNNIFYNWGDKAGYGSENGAKTYIQNNIYKPGPATPAGKRSRIFSLSVGQKYQSNMLGSVYAVGNKIDVDANDSDYANAQLVNADNWQDDLHTGVYVDPGVYGIADSTNAKITTPNQQYQTYEAEYPITLDPTDKVYDEVINGAGARIPAMDKVDQRIIYDVDNRTAPNGSKGSVGLFDDPIDGIDPNDMASYDDRGYPTYIEETRASDYDTDNDGIPDTWEDKMGLEKTNPNDSTNIGPDGLTWLEIFVEEAITNPNSSELTVKVDKDTSAFTNKEDVKLSATIGESLSTHIESYENGNVKVVKGEDFTTGTAVACSYDKAGAVIETKTAEVNSETGIANVGEVTGDSVKVFLFENMDNVKPLCSAFDPSKTVVSSSEVAQVDFYCNDQLVGSTNEVSNGSASVNVKLPTGSDLITAKAILKDGTYLMSPVSERFVFGAETPEDWVSLLGSSYDGESYTMVNGGALMKRNISGDFDLFAKIDEIPNTYSDFKCGLTVASSSAENSQVGFAGKGYDAEYKEQLYYSDGSGDVKVWDSAKNPISKYTLFKISHTGNSIALYAGTSLADWEKISEFDTTTDSYSVGASTVCDSRSVGKLSALQLVTEHSNPTVTINNFKENDRLNLNDTIDVTLTPDKGKKITEVWVYANGVPVASKNVEISDTQNVSIPVTFTTPQSAELTVYCFDENLGNGSTSINVSISQDATPWLLGDIGGTDQDTKSFVLATDDYTFKLTSDKNGNIGGTSDKFGYLYQRFEGNNRMYYRSRMQDGKQFGVVIKNDLSADGVTYYFGGNVVDGALSYSLQKRDTVGGEMTVVSDVTSTIGNSPNMYFIIEKVGDKINVYQTENGATIYQTKTLLASVDAVGIGDEYYMGFGAVSGDGNPSDSGWVALENLSSTVQDGSMNRTSWNFNNGLDWLWQMQEKNVLRHKFSSENISNNSTGKLQISTTGDYTSDRYIFREYQVPTDKAQVISAGSDVNLMGDQTELNVYLQVKDGNQAFKITFGEDGYVYVGGEKTTYAYDKSKWYHVEYESDLGYGGNTAKITVTDMNSGQPFVVESANATDFRTQINTEKKYPVTNAIYFEPTKGMTANYYIDNVYVDTKESTHQKTILDSHLWDFQSGSFDNATSLVGGQTYDGLSVIGGGAVESKNKTIGGIAFTRRYKMGGPGSKTSKCVKFTVPAGTTDIKVYGESANSSQTRTIILDDGSGNVASVGTTSTGVVEYSYTGESRTFYVYGDSGINLYGINFETYTYGE